MWELDTLQYDAITVCFPSRNTSQPDSLVSLKPNSIRHLIMLRKYIHHMVQDSHLSVASDASDHVLEHANFLHTTFHQFMSLHHSFPNLHHIQFADIFQESSSLLPKGIGNNTIFLFQRHGAFDGTAKGRTWLVGYDFPGSPRLHMIDLEFLDQNTFCRLTKTELSKNNAIDFGRNLHLLVSNPLFPVQRHLDLF